jgi:hypothetical protein
MGNYNIPLLTPNTEFIVEKSRNFSGTKKDGIFLFSGTKERQLIYGFMEQNWQDSIQILIVR